jgi:hypothetical protein
MSAFEERNCKIWACYVVRLNRQPYKDRSMSRAPVNRTLSLFPVRSAMFHLQFPMRGTQRIPNYITTETNIYEGSAPFTHHITFWRRLLHHPKERPTKATKRIEINGLWYPRPLYSSFTGIVVPKWRWLFIITSPAEYYQCSAVMRYVGNTLQWARKLFLAKGQYSALAPELSEYLQILQTPSRCVIQ